jgi:hypothetical protein
MARNDLDRNDKHEILLFCASSRIQTKRSIQRPQPKKGRWFLLTIDDSIYPKYENEEYLTQSGSAVAKRTVLNTINLSSFPGRIWPTDDMI